MTYGPQETQSAIYQVLSTDTALQTLLGGTGKIFDVVPQEQVFPFITIGDMQWEDRGNHGAEGLSGKLTINVWYRSPNQGRKGVQVIQKRIDELIHSSEPTITGWNIIGLRRSTTNIIVDVDNFTLHGIQTFNLMIGEQ